MISIYEKELFMLNKDMIKGGTELMILKLLSEKRMYGYEMIKAMEERSENVFTLKAGTLYPILHSLELTGKITGDWDESSGLRKRKFYSITVEGQDMLKRKEEEWNKFSKAVGKVLVGGPAYGIG